MVKVRRVPTEERRAIRTQEPHSRRFYDMVGLGLFFIGVACLLWLAWPQEALIPRVVHDTLRLLAGSGSWAIPLILLFIGSMFLVGYERMSLSHSTYGSLLLFLTFVTWRHLTVIGAPMPMSSDVSALNQVMLAGGYVGGLMGTLSLLLLAKIGSYILLAFMTCAAVVLIVDRPFIEVLRQARRPAMAGMTAAKHGAAVVRERREIARELRAAQVAEKALTSATENVANLPAPPTKRRGLLSLRRDTPSESETSADSPTAERGIPESNGQEASKREANAAFGDRRTRRTASGETEDSRVKDPAAASAPAENGAFQLPPLSILKEAPPASPRKAQQELAEKIKVLEQTLDQFGIGANVVEIAHGPTVTRYEIQLAPGIKVSKIVSLADNLAMALAAIDVRVEAPIPGKSAIGVEVPNSQASTVTLRECIEVAEFRGAPSKLTFALGKDVAGTTRYADLTRMPHLLIGGSTNSGKSVCLNVLIASIVYRATPDEVKFIMIDPKRVELSLWDGIPHLMHPVVKDVKQAPGIFRAALKEMDRRYELFSRMGTRNIDGYNQRVGEGEKLPYIVVVVDELADLMMQAAAEVETSICRLAQLARATGIHLVIATQRPSVDVITGTIKANISSRIAFAVSSQVDSRTILDMNGAERLIGRGDMLFLPIDASKPIRIQGCYITEAETNSLVDYLKQQAKPNYTMHPVETGGSGIGGAGSEENDEDELYESAVKLVVTNGHASTSMLQRRFKIGYTRAARLLDMMEDRGIVGPLDGAKPREILVSRDEIDQLFRGEFDNL
jgi:S-DNA-T family DNA segregation ATPase FtsK/SpoIIIE